MHHYTRINTHTLILSYYNSPFSDGPVARVAAARNWESSAKASLPPYTVGSAEPAGNSSSASRVTPYWAAAAALLRMSTWPTRRALKKATESDLSASEGGALLKKTARGSSLAYTVSDGRHRGWSTRPMKPSRVVVRLAAPFCGVAAAGLIGKTKEVACVLAYAASAARSRAPA